MTQAGAAFRTGKSDLALRPVYHQRTERVEAHILVSFLSLAPWRVLEQWIRAKSLGDCARQLLPELDELRSLDVVLPVRGGQSHAGRDSCARGSAAGAGAGATAGAPGLGTAARAQDRGKCSAENRPFKNANPCKSGRTSDYGFAVFHNQNFLH